LLDQRSLHDPWTGINRQRGGWIHLQGLQVSTHMYDTIIMFLRMYHLHGRMVLNLFFALFSGRVDTSTLVLSVADSCCK